jgi:hypothetical protein
VSRQSADLRPRKQGGPGVWRELVHSELTAVVCAAVAALFVGVFGVHNPSFVPRVTIVNDSELDIGVDVAAAGSDGAMWLGIVETGTAKTTVDVLDQGVEWVLTFRSQGLAGGELRVSRRDLEAAAWRVTIPNEVIAHLRDQGAAPSPGAPNESVPGG